MGYSRIDWPRLTKDELEVFDVVPNVENLPHPLLWIYGLHPEYCLTATNQHPLKGGAVLSAFPTLQQVNLQQAGRRRLNVCACIVCCLEKDGTVSV